MSGPAALAMSVVKPARMPIVGANQRPWSGRGVASVGNSDTVGAGEGVGVAAGVAGVNFER